MAVKLRLSRIGKKNAPFYRIVAVDSRKKRDGAFIEDLGTYSGLGSSLVDIKQDRIQDWISKGAIPSDTVKRIVKMHKHTTGAVAAETKPAKTKTTKKAKSENAEA